MLQRKSFGHICAFNSLSVMILEHSVTSLLHLYGLSILQLGNIGHALLILLNCSYSKVCVWVFNILSILAAELPFVIFELFHKSVNSYF